jgi:peptide-methionine (R)-S-oxide reductase
MKITIFVLLALLLQTSSPAQEKDAAEQKRTEAASVDRTPSSDATDSRQRLPGCGAATTRVTGMMQAGRDDGDVRKENEGSTATARASRGGNPAGSPTMDRFRRNVRADAETARSEEKTKRRNNMSDTPEIRKDWKRILTDEQYRVLREKGTEPAFSGKYYTHDEKGNYHCAGCGNLLFTSAEKYHSGSGWPSFFAPADNDNLVLRKDSSHGMIREEVLCAACGGHLGHVFDDGPKPTGLRYCINSVSLDFKGMQND